MQVAEMRALLDQSRSEFSKQYNIPLRTLETGNPEKANARIM